ncbi:ketopantoate reductase family protein [Streptomyces scabiei]|uniref:ketopantoate reductase family protein n=1 Tax=Streptomyces scabiei TaxID=1930 RepID=UPI0038F63FAC
MIIVGAGSVGVLAGYDLSRAGADVTFLVRPHRREQLARPQALYSYNDHTLHHFSDYDVITDPAELSQRTADFLIVTLDGAALRAEAGLRLVSEIGRAYRGTDTKVVLATIGLQVQSWFVQQSGLADDQVALGSTGALIHEVSAAKLPLDPTVDKDLIATADYAFSHTSPAGFILEDSSPELTAAFTSLHSGEGVPAAVSMPAGQLALAAALLAPMLAWSLLGWRPLQEIDLDDETWQVGVESTREIQRLSVFGEAGRAAAEETDAASVTGFLRQQAQDCMPIDLAAFNAYHHGGKVNRQDIEFFQQARRLAADDGAATPALDILVERLTTA